MELLKLILKIVAVILISPLMLIVVVYRMIRDFVGKPSKTEDFTTKDKSQHDALRLFKSSDKIPTIKKNTSKNISDDNQVVTQSPSLAQLVVENKPNEIYTFPMDLLDKSEHKNLKNKMLEASDMTAFTGEISHAYDIQGLRSKEICPKCGAPTQQHYANFIYSTQIGLRVMYAPAGYFCTQCPVVIIDQGLLSKGVDKKFTYRGVIGIDKETEGFITFKTWNGEPTVYIMNEYGRTIDLSTTVAPPSQKELTTIEPQNRNRKKNKIARQSRKRNRSSKK